MIDHVLTYVLPAAYSLLPAKMQSPEATALLIAIGLNESRFVHRRQIGGPARGFWQFELGGGVQGVLRHQASRPAILNAIRALEYRTDDAAALYVALEHQDTLAACFARCLLWTLPGALPGPNDAERAWNQYLDAWRPGEPHHEIWKGNYTMAWDAVLHGRTPPTEVRV